MHLSFPFHIVFMTCVKAEGSCICCHVLLRSLVAWNHAGEESSMQNRHREIILSLFVRPREISREVLLLVQYLSCKICFHRSCRWIHTGWSRMHSRKTVVLAMMQGGCCLSGWKKGLHLVPRACRGFVCIPKCRSRKNSPASMKHQSVRGWREYYRPIRITE